MERRCVDHRIAHESAPLTNQPGSERGTNKGKGTTMKNRITVDVAIHQPVEETKLAPFRPDYPDMRQAVLKLDESVNLYAYQPERLEELADAMLKLAGEMRADRTAHHQREARKDDAVNRTTAALDRFVSGQVAS